jgi:hypothetical protein
MTYRTILPQRKNQNYPQEKKMSDCIEREML